ncbi:MAG: 2-isopropylmalate synthase [Bacillota bacterium]|nr:2-isopropylmalate synthase [Bacillota bacterium]
MSKTISIFDTTLRDGEQSAGVNLNAKEKLEIARQLVKLNVDVIEAGFPISSSSDFEAVKLISQEIKEVSIAALARANEKDIDRAWQALRFGQNPRIHTFIATSDIHMKYKLKLSPEKVLENAVMAVKHAVKYTSNVEFSAEDASRSDPDFLVKIFSEVIKAGATTINIPDTVGYATPEEFKKFVRYIINRVRDIGEVTVSVHCHNDLGLAVANSIAAVEAGATQIECTVNGLGERAGNAALEEIVMALKTRNDYYNTHTNIETRQIYRTSQLVSSLTGFSVQPNKAIVGKNAFAHESGIHQHGVLNEKTTYEIMSPESIGLPMNRIVLGKHSGRHAFRDRLEKLGYQLTQEEINKLFIKFKGIADKKRTIYDEDIEALMDIGGDRLNKYLTLERFQVSCGNASAPTSAVKLNFKGHSLQEVCIGNGPVDASFKAIEKALGISLTLEDYKIRSITEGKDALAEVIVHISRESKIFIGRAVAIDVIEASIRAYIEAINRMIAGLGDNFIPIQYNEEVI